MKVDSIILQLELTLHLLFRSCTYKSSDVENNSCRSWRWNKDLTETCAGPTRRSCGTCQKEGYRRRARVNSRLQRCWSPSLRRRRLQVRRIRVPMTANVTEWYVVVLAIKRVVGRSSLSARAPGDFVGVYFRRYDNRTIRRQNSSPGVNGFSTQSCLISVDRLRIGRQGNGTSRRPTVPLSARGLCRPSRSPHCRSNSSSVQS